MRTSLWAFLIGGFLRQVTGLKKAALALIKRQLCVIKKIIRYISSLQWEAKFSIRVIRKNSCTFFKTNVVKKVIRGCFFCSCMHFFQQQKKLQHGFFLETQPISTVEVR